MLRTLVIVALQDSRKVLVFFWPTDCVSLDFFQGVGRGWPFLSFWPIIFFLFPPGGDSRYFYLLFLVGFFSFFSGAVNAGRYQISIYIYIYNFMLCFIIYNITLFYIIKCLLYNCVLCNAICYALSYKTLLFIIYSVMLYYNFIYCIKYYGIFYVVLYIVLC